jgi:hypothetical protein
MGIPANVQKLLPFGYKSVAFGTIIQQNIPGLTGFRACLLRAIYKAAGTAHNLALMYPATTNGGHAPAAATVAGSKNTASAAAAIGDTVINVNSAPTDPAGNATASGDIIAYECTDGTWEFNKVDSLAVKAITVTTALAKAIAKDAKVRILGVVADGFNIQFPCAASVTTDWNGYGSILAAVPDVGEPAVLQSDNATATGFLLQALAAYINK